MLPVSSQYSSPAFVALTTVRGVVDKTAELTEVTTAVGFEVGTTVELVDVTVEDSVEADDKTVPADDCDEVDSITVLTGVSIVDDINVENIVELTDASVVDGFDVDNAEVVKGVDKEDGDSSGSVVLIEPEDEFDNTVTLCKVDSLGVDVDTDLEEVGVLIAADSGVESTSAEPDKVSVVIDIGVLVDCKCNEIVDCDSEIRLVDFSTLSVVRLIVDVGILGIDVVSEADGSSETELAGTIGDAEVSDTVLDRCCVLLVTGNRVELTKSEDTSTVGTKEGSGIVIVELVPFVCKDPDIMILEADDV